MYLDPVTEVAQRIPQESNDNPDWDQSVRSCSFLGEVGRAVPKGTPRCLKYLL